MLIPHPGVKDVKTQIEQSQKARDEKQRQLKQICGELLQKYKEQEELRLKYGKTVFLRTQARSPVKMLE